ncbi:MAG: porphobilinogen synthase [Elusimicrobiota bacterium]
MLRRNNFIIPFFVTHGFNIRNPILSMPGQYQFSIDQLLLELEQVVQQKFNSVLLFGIPQLKDALGSEAYDSNGIIQQAVRKIKVKFPKLTVMTDLCFCEYTDHGHCGALNAKKGIDIPQTLKMIAQTAVSQATAGADFVAPSGMTSGGVKVIRTALNKAGLNKTKILAYSAKYASAFYGPFREAAGSAPQFGNRRAYQLNPLDTVKALKRIKTDIRDGAHMVMVKPALSYLDIIYQAKKIVKVPVVAYNVSGEYAMVKSSEQMGWLTSGDHHPVTMEILNSIQRAGADFIISYHALEIAHLLK